MDKKFAGFDTMAVALAAAGLTPGIGVLPAVAAAMVAMGKLKFVLIEGPWCDKRWLQELGGGEYRSPLGYEDHYRDNEIKVLEVRWLYSFADLSMEDRKKQYAWVEGGKAGWLDREGNFYPCNFEGHSALATYVLQRHYSDLERDGWIHVDGEGQAGIYTFRTVNHERDGATLTPQQEKWLVENGHDLDPRGYKKRRRAAEMITLGEGPNAVQLDAAADEEAFRRQMEKAGLDIKAFSKEKGTRLRDFR